MARFLILPYCQRMQFVHGEKVSQVDEAPLICWNSLNLFEVLIDIYIHMKLLTIPAKKLQTNNQISCLSRTRASEGNCDWGAEGILCRVMKLKYLIVAKDRGSETCSPRKILSFCLFQITFWDILHQTCVIINLSWLQRKLLITGGANFLP